MCGIAGCVAPDASVAHVEAQLATIVHRGPDSGGVHTAGPAVLGTRRLAVIDLDTGDPPITNDDGTIGVAFNGEIYNYRALRDQLLGAGHRLRTAGDTEVIAVLAGDLEPVALARALHGMFAFALWDDRRGRLVLGRDRLGKKPLYYWHGDGRFVFGSEIKAVLAHPAVRRDLDPDAIPAYLTFGYVPTPRTFFAGVHSVPPAHVLTLTPGSAPRVERYWEPPLPGVGGVRGLDLDAAAAARVVREGVEAAVARRLVADVPLGAFLSGGIDSSVVVGAMARASSRPIRTFTIGFEDEVLDERRYARAVAHRFGTEHTEFVVQPDAADLLERLVWHHDQPFGDSSALPVFVLSELTKQHVTVALTGDGGDELFAGYERFAAARFLHRFDRLPAGVRAGVRRAVAAVPPTAARGRVARLQRLLASSGIELPRSLLSFVSYVPAAWRDRLLPGASDWGLRDYDAIWARSAGGSELERILDLNLRTYLLDDLLPKADRMSMAHGLEVRSPFLDHELVELAFRLPARHKARRLSLKRVLRTAFADELPREILERGKHGFGIPLGRWFRGELAGLLDATLGAPDARTRRHLEPDALDGLLAEHRARAVDHGNAIWTLLTLELFLRREGW